MENPNGYPVLTDADVYIPPPVPWKAGQLRRGRILGAENEVYRLVGPMRDQATCWFVDVPSSSGRSMVRDVWPSDLLEDVPAEPARPTATFAPGDVITASGHRFKLLDREADAEADREGRQQWRVEALEPQFSNVDHIRFAPADVTNVVPGWRAGQRRRIRVHASYGGGTVDGIVSKRHDGVSVDGMPHVAVNLDATGSPSDRWLLRAESAMYWASETEWSELLAEAPAPNAPSVGYTFTADELEKAGYGERAYLCRPERNERVDRAMAAMQETMRKAGVALFTDEELKPYRELAELWEGIYEDLIPALLPPKSTTPAQLDALVTKTLPGEVNVAPVTFTFQPNPLREVSSNGREWVNYDSISESYPFESYKRRRVNGVDVGYVEPPVLGCVHPVGHKEGESPACDKPGSFRELAIGRAVMCDEHYLSRDLDTYRTMREREREGGYVAGARLAEMSRNAAGMGPPVDPSCQPTLFGGIWRPW